MLCKNDIEIIKGLISLIKVHNGKFSDDDIKILKGIYHIVNALEEPERWITVKGNHIPIYKGETKEQAIERFLGDKKQSQVIAGIKRGKPMSFKEANEGKVNPNYHKRYGYQNNCQICTLTFELRLRGYDIEAVPFNENNLNIVKLAQKPWIAYKDTEVLSCPAKNYIECGEWLEENIKRGERYVFGYRPGISPYKHVIEVQKDILGNIKFYDPQNGEKLKTNEVLRDAFMCKRLGADKYHYSPIIFRIYNKEINEELVENIFK